MKPMEQRGYVVLTEAPGRPAFLCKGPRGLTVTTELGKAQRYERQDDADEDRSRFEELHRHTAPSGWRVAEAVTRTVFKEA